MVQTSGGYNQKYSVYDAGKGCSDDSLRFSLSYEVARWSNEGASVLVPVIDATHISVSVTLTATFPYQLHGSGQRGLMQPAAHTSMKMFVFAWAYTGRREV